MFSFIARRVGAGVILLVAIALLSFLLLYADSASIARRLLGNGATDEVVARKTAELGLDQPVLVQVGQWASSAITGDLGRSWFSGELVSTSLAGRLGVTLSLVIGTTAVAVVVAVALGVVAARRRGWADTVIQFGVMLGFAVPGFLVALVLVLVFAVGLGWFTATGYVPPTASVSGWLASIALPVIALATGVIAAIAQQVRGSVIDALSRDYVRTLRARGLSSHSVIYKHVLRNAAGPGLAVVALQFVGLLGGAVIIEQIFALPGMGQLAVQATTQGDIPVVMGIVVVFAIIVVIVNLLVDLAQAGLNPKVRMA